MTVFRAVIGSPYLAWLLRVLLGLTFILSAVSKLPHHTEFEAIVKEYDLLPDTLASIYANTLPWAEILIGVYLIAGILFRPALLVSMLLALSFMVANTSAIIGDDPHCGSCFGDLVTLPAWLALLLDIGILLAAAHLFFRRTGHEMLALETFLKTP